MTKNNSSTPRRSPSYLLLTLLLYFLSIFTFLGAPYQIFLLFLPWLPWHFYHVVIEQQQDLRCDPSSNPTAGSKVQEWKHIYIYIIWMTKLTGSVRNTLIIILIIVGGKEYFLINMKWTFCYGEPDETVHARGRGGVSWEDRGGFRLWFFLSDVREACISRHNGSQIYGSSETPLLEKRPLKIYEGFQRGQNWVPMIPTACVVCRLEETQTAIGRGGMIMVGFERPYIWSDSSWGLSLAHPRYNSYNKFYFFDFYLRTLNSLETTPPPLKPLVHHINIVPRGLIGNLN